MPGSAPHVAVDQSDDPEALIPGGRQEGPGEQQEAVHQVHGRLCDDYW